MKPSGLVIDDQRPARGPGPPGISGGEPTPVPDTTEPADLNADGAANGEQRRRPRLDRDRIVAAALRLGRAGGAEAVTMRRVADALDAGAMSLYRHVADRQELLILMLDAVGAGLDLPPVVADPRAELTAVMTAVRDVFHRDRWAPHALVVDGIASVELLPVSERVFAALDRAGLDTAGVLGSSALLWHHAFGEAIASRHDRGDTMAVRMTRDAALRAPHLYPTITRLAAVAPPPARRYDFATNLGRVLDGILGPRAATSPGAMNPARA